MRKLPIDDVRFWRKRLQVALERGEPHRAIYDVGGDEWKKVQEIHTGILARLVVSNTRVLDAGCGFGSLRGLLPDDVSYTGVDFSPDLLELAQHRYPKDVFINGDLKQLPFPDHHFEIAICRSVDGMVKDHLGVGAWRLMEKEILRVADRMVLLNYSDPATFRVHDSTIDPKQFGRNSIETEDGYLIYRPGQDGTVELYDVFVKEGSRRKGVATRLISQVMKETFGSVYVFARADNLPAIELYRSLGFALEPIPNFYRGCDAVIAVKQKYPGDEVYKGKE